MRADISLAIEKINASGSSLISGAEWVLRPGNIAITFPNTDVLLFEYAGNDIYHLHYLFDVARGRQAIRQVKEAFATMFMVHGAALITGLTPVEIRHARLFSRWVGGRSVGIVETPHGKCEKFILTRDMWKAN